MSNTNQQSEEEKEEVKLTPHELEEKRVELDKFYDKQIPRLQKQLKYEELMTKIDKERYERFRMQFQMASAMAGPPPDETTKDKGTPPGDDQPRKLLKKEGAES